MKKLNLKVGIAAFSVMLIGLVTAALMTFNFADSVNTLDASLTDAVYAEAATTSTTMIDRIIDNSNSTDTEVDKNYHIVEITSGQPSTFQDFVNSGKFKDLIFDKHSTTGSKFGEKTAAKVDFKSFNTKSVTASDVQKADLIYITEDTNSKFSDQNDIPTDLVSVLSNFAVGDYKPFIIDTTGGKNNNADDESGITYDILYKNVLSSMRRYSFDYPDSAGTKLNVANYIQNKTQSLWLPIHGKNTSANWTDAFDGKKVASILTITKDGSDEFAKRLMGAGAAKAKDADNNEMDYYVVDTLNPSSTVAFKTYMYVLSESTPQYIKFDTLGSGEEISEADISKYDLVIIDNSCAHSTDLEESTYLAIRSYEANSGHIVYSDDVEYTPGSGSGISTTITTTAHNYRTILTKVSQSGKASYSNVLVTNRSEFATLLTNVVPDAYDSNIVYIINSASFRGSGGSGDSSNKYTMLEIEPSYPIDSNVEKAMKAHRNKSESFIAGYIGSGDYYYQDGFYYHNTINILNGPTADEISFDGGKSPISMYDANSTTTIQVPYEEGTGEMITVWVKLPNQEFPSNQTYAFATEADRNGYTWAGNPAGENADGYYLLEATRSFWSDKVYAQQEVEKTETRYKDEVVQGFAAAGTDVKEYYSWKWSKAKLAYVTGKSYDEVEVVHMSTAEFNASLDTLNDTYDIIYIGGDNSAVKPVKYWFRQIEQTVSGRWANGQSGSTKLADIRTYKQFFDQWPAYTMYYEFGDMYNTQFTYWDNDGNTINKGTYAANSGNDITNKRKSDIEKFVSANRPVIVGKDLYEAVTFDLNQPVSLKSDMSNMYLLDNKVDPNTNIYSLVSEWASTKPSNIVLNFDFDDVIRTNNADKYYGNTIGDFATVFRNTSALDGNVVVDRNQGADEQSTTAVRDYYNKVIDSSEVVHKDSLNRDYMNGNDVFKTVHNSTQRPKFVVEKSPVLYSTGAKLQSSNLNFTVRSYVDATAYVYIDDDGDGKFELKVGGPFSLTANESKSITGKPNKDYTGPVFWKLELSSGTNNTASITGVSVIETKEKYPIDILQILPSDNNVSQSGKRAKDSHIYLCKDCQESIQILTGNRLFTNSDGYNHADFRSNNAREYIYDQGQVGDDVTYGSPGYGTNDRTPSISEVPEENDYEFVFTGSYGNSTYSQVGVHEHHFGFAPIQDSAPTGQDYYMEDWNLNLFDNASDAYEIRLTLLSISDYNSLAAKVSRVKEKNAGDFAKLSDKYYMYFNAMSDILDGKDPSNYTSTIDEILAISQLSGFKTSLKDADTISAYTKNLSKATQQLAGDYANGKKYFTNAQGGPSEADYKELVSSIDGHGIYNDLYFYNTGAEQGNNVGTYQYGGHNINYYFKVWRDAKVLEQYFYQKYIYYTVLRDGGLRKLNAAEDDQDKGAFGLVVLGAAETFGKAPDTISQAGTDLLYNYSKAQSASDEPGSILLFHNVLTDSNATTYFSRKMREVVGMDTSKEFLDTLAKYPKIGTKSTNFAPIELTDGYGVHKLSGTDNEGAFVHKYEALKWTDNSGNSGVDVSNPNFDAYQFYAKNPGTVQTDYAQCSATTKGIMTSYPNSISNKIKISGTHQQTYTLNIPNKNVTVWYSLAGGTKGTDSSLLCADLNDHANNYYLYTFGNVTFFGAGHMFHTGKNRLNSEESKLIINAILNASRPSAAPSGPDLELVTHNDPNRPYPLENVPTDNGEYAIYQYVTTYSPEKGIPFKFGMKATSDVGIKYVDIWFDLAYDPAISKDHIFYVGDPSKSKVVYGTPLNAQGLRGPITGTNRYRGDGWYQKADGTWANFIKSDGSVVYIDEDAFNSLFQNLRLDDSYFPDLYGGDYTYLCVRVEDEKGKSITKTIKIKRAPFLFDIT